MARTRGRWVRWLKWTAVVLSVVIVFMWIGSAWWDVAIFPRPLGFRVVAGELEVAWNPRPPPEAVSGWWQLYDGQFNLSSWHWSVLRPGVYLLVIPLWTPLPLTLGAAIYLWRRDRRAQPGHCPACGYDLAGLPPGSACPECGKAATPAA